MWAAIGLPMMPSPRKATRSCFAMSTTSRGLDPQTVTGPQATGRLRLELLAVDGVPPALARVAARSARRGVAAALGQQRVGHVVKRFELADDAVAALVLAGAARSASHGVLDRAQGELELERLDRRVQGVRHRDVHGTGPVGVRARALAAAERL